MKRRLIKKFNEIYFKTVKNSQKALKIDSKASDFNQKSVECVENNELLNILSDLLQIENNNIVNLYSETLKNIMWDLSEANVIFRNAFVDFSESVKELCKHLNHLSDNSCFVGGCVRDTLIGETPHDFDFCTDINYDILKMYFEKNGYTVQEKGKQFLVLIISKDGAQFEITNFRKDCTYTDGRRPDSVDIGTIEDDAKRRDLTVNSGYVNTKTLRVIDPSGYFIEDIKTKTLRFIGNPKDRIQEDFLRGWRFYRFVSKGFKPEKTSLKAVRALWDEIYKKSTPERVRLEMEKIINI